MSVTPEKLAEQIRSVRQDRGLSLKQLAELAGIGKTAMFDLEHGNPGVRLNTLLAVLKILDIDLILQVPESASPPSPATTVLDSLPEHLL
jgi:transcriptional regulator with XRE-family HTH domain